MSATEKPVWVWLPERPEPVQAGVFKLSGGVGSFVYDAEFRKRGTALALDPMNLPLTRSQRPLKEIRQGGLFGVFRDASPEGFGLALLEQSCGRSLSEPLERLEASVGDAVGAIEVCDDLGTKLEYQAPDAERLLSHLANLPETRPSSQAVREIAGMHGTSLGGERPKLTVQHKGQLWIAKLQDRGDAAHAPLREYMAMTLAKRCGLEVCDVEFVRVGQREVLLVKRFDRVLTPDGQTLRHLYASAHTVLRLDGATLRDDRRRSYPAFAQEVMRWCGSRSVDPQALRREVWRRLAFNALCGNEDDHPRNHGLLHRDGHWGLAPAFDIAPYGPRARTLAMAIDRTGTSVATRAVIIGASGAFGWEKAEAVAWLDEATVTIAAQWPAQLAALGFAEDALPVPMLD